MLSSGLRRHRESAEAPRRHSYARRSIVDVDTPSATSTLSLTENATNSLPLQEVILGAESGVGSEYSSSLLWILHTEYSIPVVPYDARSLPFIMKKNRVS